MAVANAGGGLHAAAVVVAGTARVGAWLPLQLLDPWPRVDAVIEAAAADGLALQVRGLMGTSR